LGFLTRKATLFPGRLVLTKGHNEKKKSRTLAPVMKSGLIFAVLVVLSLAVASTSALDVAEAKEQFDAFVSRFNKKYADANEYQQRLAAFTHNLAEIEAFNAKYGVLPPPPHLKHTVCCRTPLTWLQKNTQFGITKFSDMTRAEFKERVLMKKPGFPGVDQETQQASPSPFPTPVVIPKTFDWRNKTGILTPVYDQGDCGSGWCVSKCVLGDAVIVQPGLRVYVSSKCLTKAFFPPLQGVLCG
jgi:hypothetical protein